MGASGVAGRKADELVLFAGRVLCADSSPGFAQARADRLRDRPAFAPSMDWICTSLSPW